MKNRGLKTVAAFLFALAAFVGCRQTDVRTLVVEFKSLNESDRPAIREALSKYEGVDISSLKWDIPAKRLTLGYDSMKIAHANIRMAIEERGFTVIWPRNSDGIAGYVDRKTK